MSKPKFQVEPARLIDVMAVTNLLCSMIKELDKREPSDEERMHVMRYVMEGIASTDPIVLVAAGETKRSKRLLAGIGIFDIRKHPFGKTIAWGHSLFVRPEFRGGHIAPDLLQAGEDLARVLGAEELYFDTRFPDKFEAFGFVRDEVRMKKIVGGEKKNGNDIQE